MFGKMDLSKLFGGQGSQPTFGSAMEGGPNLGGYNQQAAFMGQSPFGNNGRSVVD